MKGQKQNRISISLNVLLVALCVILLLDRRQAPPVSADLAPKPEPVADGANSAAAAAWANVRPVTPRRSWAEVLRDEGVPEKVIARLVLADFDDRWQARQNEAQQAYNRGDLDADGLARLDLQHDVEQENYLRSVMGGDAFQRWDQDRLFQQFNLAGLGLTLAESNSLYVLAVDLRQRQRELTAAKQQNQIDQAALDAGLKSAQTQFEERVRALLGDKRYQALHGTDPVVGDLRRGLRDLTVDAGQFSTLLQAQQSWETARARMEEQKVETGDASLDQQIQQAASERDQAFEDILGTDGYAAFKKSQDSRYAEMEKNAARWGLADSDIDYVYGQIQDYEQTVSDSQARARAMETQGTQVDWAVFQQQLQTYGQQMAGN